MAAIKNSEAVQIKYLRDIVPEYDEDDCDEDLPALIQMNYAKDPRVMEASKELLKYGTVIVGMASCWEIVAF